MIAIIYTVYDIQAKRAIQPLIRENDQIAARDFEQLVATQKPFNNNPDDYVLYRIGQWDDETMYIEPTDPKRIYTGLEALSNWQHRQAKLNQLQLDIEELKNPNAGGTD